MTSTAFINKDHLKFQSDYRTLETNRDEIKSHVEKIKTCFTSNCQTYGSANNMQSTLGTLLDRVEFCDDKVRKLIESIDEIKKDIVGLQSELIKDIDGVEKKFEAIKRSIIQPDAAPPSVPGWKKPTPPRSKENQGIAIGRPLPPIPQKTQEDLEMRLKQLRFHDFGKAEKIVALKTRILELEEGTNTK